MRRPMSREWSDFGPSVVRARFDRLARYYLMLYPILGMPLRSRSRAIRMMALRPGNRVLEVGCGTGRNFALLERAVNKSGSIWGVDFSAGMLEQAKTLCARKGWLNITLIREDAAAYTLDQQVDGALFSLCYGTMANRVEALRHAWSFIRPGGSLVVFDGRVPEGAPGRALNGYVRWISRITVLANPYTDPEADLKRIASDIADTETEYLQLGTYYIFKATKA
jgi:ubiquinone/menaquinone biosynthesis C-methylase UbiE